MTMWRERVGHKQMLVSFLALIALVLSFITYIPQVSATVPSVPRNLVISNIGNGFVTVAWDAPSTGTPTDYVVQRCNSSGASCVTFNDGVSIREFAKVTGLTNGTAYTFRVASKNASGTSAYTSVTASVEPAPQIMNGSFETDALESTTMTNWTLIGGNVSVETNGFIDLGVTNIGGCVSEDTTNYGDILTRDANKYGAPSSSAPTDDNDGGSFTTTFTSIAKTVALNSGGLGPTDGDKMLYMELGGGSRNQPYHILHGPAIYSDAFSAIEDQVVTLDWFSAAGGDDYAVLGYLLDVDTCTQYEVIDQTGSFTKSDDGTGTYVSDWQFSSFTIPATKSNYRFVFVNGTFDRSGGRYSGASFWLDNITIGFPQTITFPAIPDASQADTVVPDATSNSGLRVRLVSLTPSVCTVNSDRTITFPGNGVCTIVASQPGGERDGRQYAAAQSVTRTFNVASAPATATRTLTPSPTITSSPTLTSSPTFTASPTFTPTPHPFALKDVAVGASFTLAVLNNGSLVTWGFNREGQASLPVWMATKPVKEVEVGSNYVVVLGEDGRVYGWGRDEFGQLKIPTSALSNVRTISASLGHVMAIKTNGDLVIWGRNDFKQQVVPLAARKRLIAVGAGHSHALAVKSDGKVVAWGRNTWGQTNVPKTLTNVIAVAGGFDHSLALRSNGTIVCWGRNHEGQCKIPPGLKDVVKISAGVSYSMALTRDGKVFAWGRNDYGQAKVPTGLSPVGAIAAGYVNSVVGMRDANVRAFGNAMHGSLVSRTPTVAP